VELPERLLDAVTAVSGSGPAYLFFLAQAWQEAAASLGLSAAVAQRAVRQTLRGSLQLLESSTLTPAEWIAKVASKKGTTEAALKVLARRRVKAHIIEAIHAAARRSKQLSKVH
jgi:pyrroline-5-carboxylate reductase